RPGGPEVIVERHGRPYRGDRWPCPHPFARAIQAGRCHSRRVPTSAWINYEANCTAAAKGAALVCCGFPDQLRSSGHAVRAMHLLLHHLATRTDIKTAVVRLRRATACST